MEVGQTVTINGTDSVWDGKQGIIEDILDGVATVFVDFDPKQGKKVRQDFPVESLTEMDESYHWHPSRAARREFAKKMDEIDDFCLKNDISNSSSNDSYYFTIGGQDYRVSNHSPEASYAHSHGKYHWADGSGSRDEDTIYINAGKTRIIQIYNDLKAGKKLDGNGYVKEGVDESHKSKAHQSELANGPKPETVEPWTLDFTSKYREELADILKKRPDLDSFFPHASEVTLRLGYLYPKSPYVRDESKDRDSVKVFALSKALGSGGQLRCYFVPCEKKRMLIFTWPTVKKQQKLDPSDHKKALDTEGKC